MRNSSFDFLKDLADKVVQSASEEKQPRRLHFTYPVPSSLHCSIETLNLTGLSFLPFIRRATKTESSDGSQSSSSASRASKKPKAPVKHDHLKDNGDTGDEDDEDGDEDDDHEDEEDHNEASKPRLYSINAASSANQAQVYLRYVPPLKQSIHCSPKLLTRCLVLEW
jgi:hypothetical protein